MLRKYKKLHWYYVLELNFKRKYNFNKKYDSQ